MPSRPYSRDANIHIRAHLADRDLIDRAAELAGKTRSEFIIESARDKAQDMLLDQRIFPLTAENWEKFVAELDRPATENSGLTRLFDRKAPWIA